MIEDQMTEEQMTEEQFETKYIVRPIYDCAVTNAKYGFVMNCKGYFEPIDDYNVKNVRFFDSEEDAIDACRTLTNVSVDRVLVARKNKEIA